MVDIAIRALSPAVNDPTTAVQVLDHLGDTLRLLGATSLPTPVAHGADVPSPGLVVSARRWEDIVEAAFTEIRQYGGSSVQVVRRLRALLEDLRERVLPEHQGAVEDELARLDATIDKHWTSSVDLDRARRADGQGIGLEVFHAPSPFKRSGRPGPGGAYLRQGLGGTLVTLASWPNG